MITNVDTNNLTEDKKLDFKSLHVTVEDAIQIKSETQTKGTSSMWHALRQFRITAGKIGQIWRIKMIEALET